MRLIAKVKNIINENRYLGIEYDIEKLNQGVFLYYLLNRDFETCQHDSWFINIEIAKQVALDQYGIRENEWDEYDT